MTLYEIDQKILDIVDPETGEISDVDALTKLEMERDKKIENVGCWVKDLRSDIEAIKAEEKSLHERRDAAERKIESLKSWLNRALNGQKFSTGKCEISFRHSTALDVDEPAFVEWAQRNNRDELLSYKDPSASKKNITQAIKDGQSFPYCTLVEKRNVSVK